MTEYDKLSVLEKVWEGGIIPFGGLILLAAFVPVLSGIAVWIKATSEPARLQSAVDLYGIQDDKYYKSFISTQRPSIVKQTCVPIIVMTIVNVYFATLMIYTPVVLRPPEYMANFLLLGSQYGIPHSTGTDQYMLKTFDAMCYAYLGWFVWTVATIFSRITSMELVPATYYSLLTRLVVAIMTAVVFRHLHMLLLPSQTLFLAEAVGFGVGLFPDTAFQWLIQKLRRLLLGDAGDANTLPLDLIQGISPYRKFRLLEIGLDNCMNLASANPLTLYLASNLSLQEVIDWIAQAQLLIRVGPEKFAILQTNGYRTIIDLERAAASPALPRLVELLGFPQVQIDDLRDGIRKDQTFHHIVALHDRIA